MDSQSHVQAVPGTVQLMDLTGSLQFKHASHKSGQDAVVLVPQPSSHPDDPLNWSRMRKMTCSICLLLNIFMGGIMTTLLSPSLVEIASVTSVPLYALTSGLGLQYLFYGWANLFWQPLSLNYGRRPILLLSIFAQILLSIWTPYIRSTNEWYVNRFLIGVAYAPTEIIIEICFADIWFIHERGFWIGMYCILLFGATFLGGAVSGFITLNIGWEWIQYIASIISGAGFIVCFFFLEETMFFRGPSEGTGLDVSTSSDIPVQASETPALPGNEKIDLSISKSYVLPEEPSPQLETVEIFVKKSFLARLALWGARRPGQNQDVLLQAWLPFLMLRFPVIIFSGLLVGSMLSWYTVLSSTLASTLTAAPYSFNTAQIGLISFAPLIGIMIGCGFTAVAVNRFPLYLSSKRGGYFEPEYRLWICVFAIPLHVGGSLLWGLGSEYGIHWVGLAVGLGMAVATFPIGTIVGVNYIMDTYPEAGGPALVSMICLRNTMAFVMGYGVTPWVDKTGIGNVNIVVAVVGLAIWCLCFAAIQWGKRLRAWNAAAYYKMVHKHRLAQH